MADIENQLNALTSMVSNMNQTVMDLKYDYREMSLRHTQLQIRIDYIGSMVTDQTIGSPPLPPKSWYNSRPPSPLSPPTLVSIEDRD